MVEPVITFFRDLRSAVRSLGRAKGRTVAVILTLALGIGANSAMFSLVRGVLLRPLVNRDESGWPPRRLLNSWVHAGGTWITSLGPGRSRWRIVFPGDRIAPRAWPTVGRERRRSEGRRRHRLDLSFLVDSFEP
jgi:hypothetical protein